jgi:hypothetical protein
MGDKSPKSTKKQASQKQTKTDASSKKKHDADLLKQVPKTPPKK